ncbi:hypothetical protein [Candidatus Phyllobacterium onerii]|uniref:hypothetical protein n=1 Tax=Candidatus Phyllobacterium onerii TaxID=3020828 RepID=UPI00232D4F2C|nr:hypothetical protein [Phyllobacterium sp. IY22]
MLDLFEPRLPDRKLHSSFREIRTNPTYAKVMPVIQHWAAGLLDRKGEVDKFVKEFQSTFNSSMWEIYLNKALTDLGCSVDYSKPSPDFFVTAPGNYEFNIEAVISDQPASDKERKPSSDQDPKNRSALKLVGKIRDKINIYRGSGGKKHPYSSLSHVQGRPFVIAIAPFDSNQSLLQNNELINLVLFGIGAPVLEGSEFRQDKVTSIATTSGAPVEMGIFTNDSFKEISAVIFSTVGTFGKAVVESKIERFVRATRYRLIEKERVPLGSPMWDLGTHRFQVDKLNYLLTQRWDFGRYIVGADVHIQHSSFHQESHFDGLHVYFNPFAEVPFDSSFAWPGEVSRNYYDVAADQPIQIHPDRALVSRQVFEVSTSWIRHLLGSYGFD